MSNIDIEKETLFLSSDLVFYTVEGEGEYVGQPSVFMRTSMCNLRCPGFQSEASPNGCDLRIMQGGVGIEKTAEWCFKAAKRFLENNSETKGRCWVSKVEVWEHEQNSAIYTE